MKANTFQLRMPFGWSLHWELSLLMFPLTPALSLGERVQRRPSLDSPERLFFSHCGEWFSLSPRERAGVRGNYAYEPANTSEMVLCYES